MFVKKEAASRIDLEDGSFVLRYDHEDKNINLAVGHFDGRHPQKGKILNEKSKIPYYVREGALEMFLQIRL